MRWLRGQATDSDRVAAFVIILGLLFGVFYLAASGRRASAAWEVDIDIKVGPVDRVGGTKVRVESTVDVPGIIQWELYREGADCGWVDFANGKVAYMRTVENTPHTIVMKSIYGKTLYMKQRKFIVSGWTVKMLD